MAQRVKGLTLQEFHHRTLIKGGSRDLTTQSCPLTSAHTLWQVHALRSYIRKYILKLKIILEEESHVRQQDTAWLPTYMAGPRLEPREGQDTPGSQLTSAGEARRPTTSMAPAIAGLPAALL